MVVDVPLEDTLVVFFGGSRPGRGARIPRAVLTGEAGLLGGYGGCGCPGQGLGYAESLSGVPRLYGSSRVLQDVKTIIVYQKWKLKSTSEDKFPASQSSML